MKPTKTRVWATLDEANQYVRITSTTPLVADILDAFTDQLELRDGELVLRTQAGEHLPSDRRLSIEGEGYGTVDNPFVLVKKLKRARTEEAVPTPLERVKGMVENKACHIPELPEKYLHSLVDRRAACETVKNYLKGVRSNTNVAKDGRFPLLGCSGMKGIGKTAMLVHIASEIVPEVGEDAKAIYLTFNGGGAHKVAFNDSLKQQKTPKNFADAFGHMVLAACGVEQHLAQKLDFGNCLKVCRSLSGISSEGFVVFLVDEIGDLEEEQSLATMRALMGQVDDQKGRLAFVFAHIRQDFLNKGATASQRVVKPLPLPALSFDHMWQVVDPRWKAAAVNHPQIHQLLLACCGHPRSLVDGLSAVLENQPSLLTSPTERSLILAVSTIVDTCKFNDISHQYMETIAPRWFRGDSSGFDELARDGLLITLEGKHGAENVVLLQPLLLLHWAQEWGNMHSIPYHLNQVYAADSVVGSETEKKMEDIMYHYEALLKKCLAGEVFTLEGFYSCKHIGPKFFNRRVKAPLPEQMNLVQKLPNFSDKRVLHYLKDGYIVVSTAHSELGIEYLSPFVCARSGELIVAAVQCKFVQKACDWADMKSKMTTALERLTGMGVCWFPVFYTTADQSTIKNATCSDGIYFIESDLFTFTRKMGILRLHVMKLGENQQSKYPWLQSQP